MSFAYTKVTPPLPSSKLYGFGKVPMSQMPEIIDRIAQSTHSSSISSAKIGPQVVPALCRKAPSDAAAPQKKAQVTDHDINKIVRRLRTPTISKLAAAGLLNPAYEAKFREEIPKPLRPKTASEYHKILKRIQRTTSSSRGKTFVSIYEDPQTAPYAELDFSNEDPVSKEEIDLITERVKVPTMAKKTSNQSAWPECPRVPRGKCLSPQQRHELPLVSGLPKSKNVTEIVDRLYGSGKGQRNSQYMYNSTVQY